LLLKGQPHSLDEAIKQTNDAEYALPFESTQEEVHHVNAALQKLPQQPSQRSGQLEIMMDK